MGSGLFPSLYSFKRRGNTDLGIDLCYDKENASLALSVRYQKQQVRENLLLRSLIEERESYDGETIERQVYYPVNHHYVETIKQGNFFQFENCTYEVLDNYSIDADKGLCVVTASAEDGVPVGSRREFLYEVIHDRIFSLVSSMFD